MSTTFILVHGAWHAAWCWERVATLLRASGNTVLTPDLPGHGRNYRPAREVTFEDYVASITTLSQQQNTPVTLVGHSMAGLVVSQVAEHIPELINELIYIAAYIPNNQESLLSIAENSESRGVSPLLIFDQTRREIRLKGDDALFAGAAQTIESIFFNRCTPEDTRLAIARLQPQPLQPFTRLVTLGDNFKRVKKTAIICQDDNALLPSDQIRMSQTATDHLIYLDTDHSAYYSAPKALTSFIDQH